MGSDGRRVCARIAWANITRASAAPDRRFDRSGRKPPIFGSEPRAYGHRAAFDETVRATGAGHRKTGSTRDSRRGHAVFNMKSIHSMLLSNFGPATPMPDFEAVRRLCVACLADVP